MGTGMITSASLAWETTTFSSTTPPTRLATPCSPSRSSTTRASSLGSSGSTLPPCPETSGSILMPWPSLPSLTGWSPQSPVVTHHSHQRGGRGRHHLHFRPPTCITDLLEYPGL